MTGPSNEPLRAITYLAPGIPLAFFEHVAAHVARALGREVRLESEKRISGPMHGDHDPFSSGQAQLGFLCSPSYLYLRSRPTPSVQLVPAGFVFDDPRNGGEPLYFSDVIVRAERTEAQLVELRGTTFGFNDGCSLSGYYAARQELARRAPRDDFFGSEVCTGSHAASIDAVLSGAIDVAAIDSNVLAHEHRVRPELNARLRTIESWGPHPIQPVVLCSALHAAHGPRIRAALLELTHDTEARNALAPFGFSACVPIDAELYAAEQRSLEQLGQLNVRCDPDA